MVDCDISADDMALAIKLCMEKWQELLSAIKPAEADAETNEQRATEITITNKCQYSAYVPAAVELLCFLIRETGLWEDVQQRRWPVRGEDDTIHYIITVSWDPL